MFSAGKVFRDIQVNLFRLNSVCLNWKRKLIDARLIKPSADDILDARLLGRTISGDDAVTSAALAHADIPGFGEGDYRLN